MRVRTRTVCVVALVGAVLSALTGCAASGHERDPYQLEFERALAETSSEFQRDILSDYTVTDAEYQAARERFSACMKDAGITVQLSPEGGYSAAGLESEHGKKTDLRCNEDSLTEVESLYWATHSNPDNRSYFALVLECLTDAGLADTTLTETQLETLFQEVSSMTDAQRAGYTLPSGVPVDDPAVKGCFLQR